MSRSRPGPFGDLMLVEAEQRRALESEVRHSGQEFFTQPQLEFLVKLTSYIGADPDTGAHSYAGDMQEAPFLLFRETPDEEEPLEVEPILGTNTFEVLDETVTERFIFAKPIVNSEGETRWYFTYFESLPPGGEEGMSLHRDGFGTAFWEYDYITY